MPERRRITQQLRRAWRNICRASGWSTFATERKLRGRGWGGR